MQPAAQLPGDRPSNPIRESVRVLGVYLRARILIAALLTLLYAFGFAIARVPLWPVVAVIGGLSSFVPSIGALVPLVLAVASIALVQWNLAHVLLALGVWTFIQLLEAFFITPRLLSRPLGLRALPVFLALLAGSLFFGPVGVLLAVPVLAVGLVFWRALANKQ
ncbi:MAG: AI-2E family transporter [Acidobacteriaceae bacterium]|nr:AI-2E family transporter [Acidobacteriaceae bacterium]